MTDSEAEPQPIAPEILKRFIYRERNARKQAERLLEEKSRQLYQSNQNLRQLTQALATEVQRSKVIFETAAEGIILFDKDGRIELLNPAAKQKFELHDEDCANLYIGDLLVLANGSSGVAADGFYADPLFIQGNDHEVVGRRKHGAEFPAEFIVAEFTHNGRVAYSGFVRDLTRRKFLESRLAHAERLESVGQLAVGIAHEVNTPIQFVSENTRFLKSSFQALIAVCESVDPLLEQCQDLAGFEPAVAAVRSAMTHADLDFLISEIPLTIDQTLEGTNKIASIIRALNVFAHPGSNEFKKTDLNHELESTLIVSKHEWQSVAVLETEFAPNLPRVNCMPGELNQVFHNLIVNAAHAIQARNSDQLGKITIRTRSDTHRVLIDISDNGTGIPEAIRSRIFDPFFTTKGIGKATGQGLSVCYHVVKAHGGLLTFDTREGEGTTFHIELFVDPMLRKADANEPAMWAEEVQIPGNSSVDFTHT